MQEVFNTFDKVKHKPLQVYNRMVTAFNIMEDYGPYELEVYYDNFNQDERKEIISMMQFTKQFGREEAKRVSLENFIPEEDESEGVGNG